MATIHDMKQRRHRSRIGSRTLLGRVLLLVGTLFCAATLLAYIMRGAALALKRYYGQNIADGGMMEGRLA